MKIIKKGSILRALLVPSSNISLEFNCSECSHVFLYALQDNIAILIEIDTDTFLFLLVHCVYAY
jgi:hypothetical protein